MKLALEHSRRPVWFLPAIFSPSSQNLSLQNDIFYMLQLFRHQTKTDTYKVCGGDGHELRKKILSDATAIVTGTLEVEGLQVRKQSWLQLLDTVICWSFSDSIRSFVLHSAIVCLGSHHQRDSEGCRMVFSKIILRKIFNFWLRTLLIINQVILLASILSSNLVFALILIFNS